MAKQTDLKNKVAEQIRFWRKKRGLTQTELATRAGLASKTVVSGYETGVRVPSFEVIEKFAEVLNVEAAVIFKDKYV